MINYVKDVLFILKYSVVIDFSIFLLLIYNNSFNISDILGTLFGLTVMSLNFLILVRTSIDALKKTPYQAQKHIFLSYFLRYTAILIILSIAFLHKDINEWMIIIHLFYPKVFFSLRVFLGKED
ncbi:MAG: ATP synthase subunit I [Oscillospiraceae bacterium]